MTDQLDLFLDMAQRAQRAQAEINKLTRKTDPITSREAAADVVPKTSAIQAEVFAFIRGHGGGVTDVAMVAQFPQYGPSTVRTRRSELVAKGLVRQKQIKGSLIYVKLKGSKRRHIVWEVVP